MHACLLLIAFVTVLAGGGQTFYSTMFITVSAGLLLIFSPPHQSAGKWIDIATILAIAGAVFQWVPIPDLLLGSWRARADSVGYDFLTTTMTQPVVHFEAVIALFTGITFLYTCLNNRPDHERRLNTLFAIAVLISLMAMGFIVGNNMGLKYPTAEASQWFTYFPNKNQSVLLFIVGAVISLGLALRALRNGFERMLPYLLMFVLNAYAVFEGVARSGVVLLVLGTLSVSLAMNVRVASRMKFKAYFIVGILIIAGTFVLFTSDFTVAERLKRLSDFDVNALGARLFIYTDALRMTWDNLFTGVGLGHFQYVFPQYYKYFDTEYIAIHPESDWLWLWTELGVLGIASSLLGLVALSERMKLMRLKRHRSAHIIASVSLLIMIIHSLVDVPLHRPALWLLACLLIACMDAQGVRRMTLPRLPFQALGVGLVLFTVVGAASKPLGLHFNAQHLREYGREHATVLRKSGDKQAYSAFTHWWSRLLPLHWQSQYYLAIDRLNDLNYAQAEFYFRRARFLTPYKDNLRYAEGLIWLRSKPEMVAPLWTECLLICPKPDYEPEKFKQMHYRRMLKLAYEDSEARGQLDLTTRGVRDVYPEIRIAFLTNRRLHESTAQAVIEEIEETYGMDIYNQRQMERMMLKAMDNKDGERLLPYLSSRLQFKNEYWRAYSVALARQGFHKKAYIHAKDYLVPVSMPVLEDKESPLGMITEELNRAIRVGSWEAVIQTSDLLHNELGEMPPYLHYWLSVSYANVGNYEEAWEHIEAFIQYR